MSKQIFITGIAGFIGFHLAKALKARGDIVSGCDNFNDYYSPEFKHLRASHLKELGISILEEDICNLTTLDSITHLVHLAAQPGVRHSITHPHIYAQANLNGFLSILELCRNQMPINLIYASSSSVYGLNQKIPFNETDRTDQPASLYAATKKANEMMAHAYHHLYNIPMTSLRFFTVYGPWGRPDMAYFSFANAILEGKPINVFNNGKMRRDFTYIDDIINGVIIAIDRPCQNEIFNLGNNRSEELMDLIAYLEEGLKKKAIINYLPMQKGEVKESLADISSSQEKLRFSPKTSLQEGIQLFIDWFLANRVSLS